MISFIVHGILQVCRYPHEDKYTACWHWVWVEEEEGRRKSEKARGQEEDRSCREDIITTMMWKIACGFYHQIFNHRIIYLTSPFHKYHSTDFLLYQSYIRVLFGNFYSLLFEKLCFGREGRCASFMILVRCALLLWTRRSAMSPWQGHPSWLTASSVPHMFPSPSMGPFHRSICKGRARANNLKKN